MHRSACLLPMMMTMLGLAMPASAVSRIELSVARIEAPDWQARALHVDWQPGSGPVEVRARLKAAAVPAESTLLLRCERLESGDGLGCANASARVANTAFGQAELRFGLHLSADGRWTLDLASARARLDYNASDGRLATEALVLDASGRIRCDAGGCTIQARMHAPSGQAYLEPLFLDLTSVPLLARIDAHKPADSQLLRIRNLEASQTEVAALQLSGTVDLGAMAQRHHLQVRLQATSLDAAVATYLTPLLAGTRVQDLQAGGRAQATLGLEDGRVLAFDAELRQARLDSRNLGLMLDGLDGELHWRRHGESPASRLRWRSGRVVALPIGAAEFEARARGRDLRLLRPARIPVLDGALHVKTLMLGGIGSDNPAATFDASLEPIDLALLGRSLGWPEFGGRLSGRLPGLRLQDRELSLDGALTAQVFDGEITVEQVRIVDPFGVLPRVRADLRLHRLDLDAITRAFSFGRITGRLDGEIEDLRLLGWEPVAMRARLYSTPGDGARRRISQRAIDNISSIGGGPTGVLSRGVMRLFDDFAYARMGWSCVLANGICRMDGIAPAPAGADGQPGYILVQGRLLPRIDVIGYTREVGWNTFVRQLSAVRSTEGVEVR